MLEQKETLIGGIKTAKNWQEVHQVFEAQGLMLKKKGAGLIIAQGKHHMKASTSTPELLKEHAGEAFRGV